MSDFSIFLEGSKVDEVVEFVASKRFVKDGEPVKWKIKAIDAELDEAIRKECTKKVQVGKRGQYREDVDTDKYTAKMCVASTVYPDLREADFQDAFGVYSGEELLKTLLKPGEYTEYKAKVMEVNGYDLTMDEMVEEAKN